MLYILGDIGEYSKEFKGLMKKLKKNLNQNDTLILLGDNFYPQGVKSIDDKAWNQFKKTFNVNNTIYSILGNHDYQLNPYAQIQFKYKNYSMQDWYYTKIIDNIQCWFLDTQQLVTLGYLNFSSDWGHVSKAIIQQIHGDTLENLREKQLNWFKKSLELSKYKNKIVFGHYPLITYGHHNNEMPQLKKLLLPILKKYNVLAYVSGHDHNSQHIPIKYIKNGVKYTMHQIICGNTSKLDNRMVDTNLKIVNGKIKEKNFFYSESHCLLRLDTKNLVFDYVNKKSVIKRVFM
uniref:Calcineurin-like phosphoesterase domain-containing protein n=1 Tax=viral metagenome TaxID=1070528 RepID=A0A6C0J1K5_9ZZZZ